MDKLLIKDSSPPSNEIRVSDARNAALPIMCAVLLAVESLALSSMLSLQNMRMMFKLLRQMGAEGMLDDHNLMLGTAIIRAPKASYDPVKTVCASTLILGLPLACFGHARVSLPSGCDIDTRPMDQHIRGLQLTGIEIVTEHDYIEAKLVDGVKRPRGARIVTDMVTAMGTKGLLMVAVLANDETMLGNAAREPEVIDLANLFVKAGAHIEGIGTDRLVIQGVEALHGVAHTAIADRIEVGTFLCAVIAAGGDVMPCAVPLGILDVVLNKLHEAGVTLTTGDDWIRIQMIGHPRTMSFHTPECPALPTGMQVQFMMLSAIVGGSAMVTETIFENHFMHVQGLSHPGANIVIGGRTAVVTGVEQLSGATVMAIDLCTSVSLVITGLIVRGETLVDRTYHPDRGYDRIEDKLSTVGARIHRIQG